jgi:hypothetical protein
VDPFDGDGLALVDPVAFTAQFGFEGGLFAVGGF